MSIPISPAEHYEYIKHGAYSDIKIRQLIDSNIIDRNKLVEWKILSEDRIKEIMYVSPDEHMEKIRNNVYTPSEIKRLLDDNAISESELVRRKILSAEQIDEILKKKVNYMDMQFDWSDVPALMPDRVDVFVLGITGSGKSSFMAGLIYHAHTQARLDTHIKNLKGFKYAMQLVGAVENGLLPKPTPYEYVQYMACDLKEKDLKKRHPLTFIEMSGEVFESSYGIVKGDLNKKFHEYLFDSPNNKIIFLTLDYHIHSDKIKLKTSQQIQFDYILKFIAGNGGMENTEAICILITKWDESTDTSRGAATAFLKKYYFSLYTLCQEYQEAYGLIFEVLTFSLGKFDERGRYEYDETDSARLLEWLVSFSPIQRKRRRGINIWGGKNQ